MKLVLKKSPSAVSILPAKPRAASNTVSPGAYSFDPMEDGVTQSVLSQWLSCREKARISIILGLSSPGASWPLIYGSVAHLALKLYYGDLVLKISPRHQWYAYTAATAFAKSIECHNNLERQDMCNEAGLILGAMLPAYHKKWGATDGKVRWTVVESKFRREVPPARCVATGQIDGGFEVNGKHWLFETKNKSSFNQSYERWLGIDLQLGYYLLGYRALMKTTPVGAVYNILRRPDRLKAKSIDMADYVTKITNDVAKRPEHYFMRYRQPFSAQEVETHECHITTKLMEFRDWYDEAKNSTNRDPLYNPGACEQFGSTCPYLDSCANDDRSGLVRRAVPHPELV